MIQTRTVSEILRHAHADSGKTVHLVRISVLLTFRISRSGW